ncbi:MAG: OsmC family protein [Solirubrobacterales bacterium]
MAPSIHRAGVAWDGGEDGDVRAHRVLLGTRSVPASCALEFGGDETRANPESLLVASLSGCHMLWFLDLARRKGFEVDSYEDDAEGLLDGKRFSSVTLRPLVRWAGEAPEPEQVEALHESAQARCYVANSVDFPVAVEPS